MHGFVMLLLFIVLTFSAVYGNLTARTTYTVYQLPQNCWYDYTSSAGAP